MSELSFLQQTILLFSGFLVGFSKTAGTSLSSIIIPLMVDIFPAKKATGILAISFFLGSFYAVYHYRDYVKWSYFSKLLPGTLIGLMIGAQFLQNAENDSIKLIIGSIILAMLLLSMTQNCYIALFKNEKANKIFAFACGILMGFCSIIANGGSSVMVIYLLICGEKKMHLIGTLAVYFLLIDIIKIPIAIWTGMIDYSSLQCNYFMLLPMLIGGYVGVLFMRWISENRFKRLVEILTFVGGLKLIYRPFINLL